MSFHARFLAALVVLAFARSVQADVFGTGGNQISIDFVPISGASNPSSGYGIVNSDYRMGTFEITNDQWNKFKAEYGPVVGSPSNAYDQDTYWAGTFMPTNNVSWYEAAQFVNWLNTNTGYQVAYKFTGGNTLGTWTPAEADNGTNLYRHKDAMYYMPTEDEWVKAAYWNGTSLQFYATPDNSVPVAGFDTNYDLGVVQPWGGGSGSEELKGTFDMMGNVSEWMESPGSDPAYGVGSNRGRRGGAFGSQASFNLASPSRYITDPIFENHSIGFRVASEVPEPSSLSLLAFGGLMLRRRGQRTGRSRAHGSCQLTGNGRKIRDSHRL